MYKATDGKKTMYFLNLNTLGKAFGYHPAYISQKVRMGYPLEGYNITKMPEDEAQLLLKKLAR